MYDFEQFRTVKLMRNLHNTTIPVMDTTRSIKVLQGETETYISKKWFT